MKWLKKLIIFLLYGNALVRWRVKFGKGSSIRDHCHLKGGKYIKIGNNSRIGKYSRIMCFDSGGGEKFTPTLTIGNNVFIGRNVTLNCSNSIEIGDDCAIAGYVFICDSNHGMDPTSNKRYELQPLIRKPVRIGNNVFIGDKTIVLPGVEIGDNCFIGAGSVITKSIEANSMAAGNPAKVIKKFNFETKQWERV